MEIEWDPAKDERNIAKHGVSFGFAARALRERMLQWRDLRADYAEERWVGLADIENRVHVIVWTMRGPSRYRLISARKANERETKRFHRQTKALAPPSPGAHEP